MSETITVKVEVFVVENTWLDLDFGDFAISVWHDTDEGASADVFYCYYEERYLDFLTSQCQDHSREQLNLTMTEREFRYLKQLFQKPNLPFTCSNEPRGELWDALRRHFPEQVRKYGR